MPIGKGGQWALWQLVDSCLPTGGFSHSLGLESAYQVGALPPGEAGLLQFARPAVHNVATQLLPFLSAGHAAASAYLSAIRCASSVDRARSTPLSADSAVQCAVLTATDCLCSAEGGDGGQDEDGLGGEEVQGKRKRGTGAAEGGKRRRGTEGEGGAASRVDEAIEAFMAAWVPVDRRLAANLAGNAVASRASSAQGAALVRLALSSLLPPEEGEEGGGAAYRLLAAMRRRSLPGGHPPRGKAALHHAPLFGAVTALLGAGEADARAAYVFVATRDVCSAGNRLGVVGPQAASALQRRLLVEVEGALGGWAPPEGGVEGARGCTPVVDVLQAGHGELFTRLFSS